MFFRSTVNSKQSSKSQLQSSSSSSSSACNHVLASKKKRSNWVLKLSCAKNKTSKNNDIPGSQSAGVAECVCTGYRRTEEHPMGAGTVFNGNGSGSSKSAPQSPVLGPLPPSPVIDLSRFNPEEFPMEVSKLRDEWMILEFQYFICFREWEGEKRDMIKGRMNGAEIAYNTFYNSMPLYNELLTQLRLFAFIRSILIQLSV